MNVCGVGEGGAVADNRTAYNNRRSRQIAFRALDSGFKRVNIVRVVHADNLPALRREAGSGVLGKGCGNIAFYRDIVFIVEEDKLAELLRTGERASLVAHTFFEAAVAAQNVSKVVYDGEIGSVEDCRKVRFGDGETYRVAEPLSQGTGRSFDALGRAVFGVSGRFRAELSEILYILDADVIPEQVQKRVQKHRAVSGGKHEPVAVIPFGIFVTEIQKIGEQLVTDRRSADTDAGVPRICFLDSLRR